MTAMVFCLRRQGVVLLRDWRVGTTEPGVHDAAPHARVRFGDGHAPDVDRLWDGRGTFFFVSVWAIRLTTSCFLPS
mgnify:CR=1